VTTFLFEGAETYIDVWGHDMEAKTATHNRAGALSRNLVPDCVGSRGYGVCLSSCLDTGRRSDSAAFNRCLILAPEIYATHGCFRTRNCQAGPHFNLHRRYRKFRQRMTLPARYGPCAVSREMVRLVFYLRNLTWNPVKYTIR